MRICSLGSGSKGNCIYINVEGQGIVIDNGLSCRELKNRMQSIGLGFSDISHILITHDHSDHVKGIGILARETQAKVYAHPQCFKAIVGKVGDVDYCGDNENYENGFYIGGVFVKPFRTPHDATYSVGYRIEGEGKVFALATDLGVVTESILKHLTGTDLTVIESNHDINMLKKGHYPEQLKRRIMSNRGHLANFETANAILKLAPSSKRFLLAHLSEDNNLKELAFKESVNALKSIGAEKGDIILDILDQYIPSKIYDI